MVRRDYLGKGGGKVSKTGCLCLEDFPDWSSGSQCRAGKPVCYRSLKGTKVELRLSFQGPHLTETPFLHSELNVLSLQTSPDLKNFWQAPRCSLLKYSRDKVGERTKNSHKVLHKQDYSSRILKTTMVREIVKIVKHSPSRPQPQKSLILTSSIVGGGTTGADVEKIKARRYRDLRAKKCVALV